MSLLRKIVEGEFACDDVLVACADAVGMVAASHASTHRDVEECLEHVDCMLEAQTQDRIGAVRTAAIKLYLLIERIVRDEANEASWQV